MRTVLIAGNWKMNHTVSEAEHFFKELKVIKKEAELLICPPFTDIPLARFMLGTSSIKWGAQNVYPEDKGAFTGEVSPVMLKDLGCTYVICGHSERRQIFKESDRFIAEKVKSVFAHDMIPILCIGETLEERDGGQIEERIFAQLQNGVSGTRKQDTDKLVIAYEPIWAIGTGKAATAENAEAVAAFIRHSLEKLVGKKAAGAIRILYGGSVNPDNVSVFIKEKNIDGVLIGGASLKASDFASIYKKV